MGSVTLSYDAKIISRAKEASRARSDSEFVSKIDQCAQEADESMLWLELLRDDCGIRSDQLDWLLNEADELIAIFVTMSKNVKARLENNRQLISGFKFHPSSMSCVIQVDRLSKQYRLGQIGGRHLVDDVNRWWSKFRGKPDPLSRIGSEVGESKEPSYGLASYSGFWMGKEFPGLP